MLDAYDLMRPMVESGRVRVLAVTGAERQALLPEVPTTGEAGMPGFVASSWHAFVAQAAAPPAVVRRVEAVGRVLRETDLPQSLAAQGATVRCRNAAELEAYMAAERERWTAVIKEAGIAVD